MTTPHRRYLPRLIAWEITRRCHLQCRHCRASSRDQPYDEELSRHEIKRTLENIASFSKPIIILTGGEPMLREDLYDIASHGKGLGLTMVMAPCGRLVTPDAIRSMQASGIARISLSIDGSTAASHDDFRGRQGSFDDAIRAARVAHDLGMPFQINTTITKANAHEIEDILALAIALGAVSFHPFLLVPTGRGSHLAHLEPSPDEYETLLRKIKQLSRDTGISVKPTCAPHSFRIQRHSRGNTAPFDSSGRGCMGGTGFAFLSHIGRVQICGFLDIACGDLRTSAYNFETIWTTSEVFQRLRTPEAYKGKCGICEYHAVCGGCRARAYAWTGDYMHPDPSCVYEPRNTSLSPRDRMLLTTLQDAFPITHDPYAQLATTCGISGAEILTKITQWKTMRLVRRLAATVDTNAMGFTGALVALCVDTTSIDEASAVIAAHPGVSHCYLRDHHYNIWLTITVPPGFEMQAHIEELCRRSKATHHLILPSLKNYKRNVTFDFVNLKGAHAQKASAPSCTPVALTHQDIRMLTELNQGLPLTRHPFAALARTLGRDEEGVLASIEHLTSCGIITTIRFALNHTALGMAANSMVVWNIEDDKKDDIGKLFAHKDCISHCYERVRHAAFPYSLYTMIHAPDKPRLDDLILGLVREVTPLSSCRLDTLKEMVKKKASLSKADYEHYC